MIEFIRVTTKTPNGDSKQYMYMGDLNTDEGAVDFAEFMVKCCDDTADFFSAPDDWDADKWLNSTMAMWEPVEGNRTTFGVSPLWGGMKSGC